MRSVPLPQTNSAPTDTHLRRINCEGLRSSDGSSSPSLSGCLSVPSLSLHADHCAGVRVAGTTVLRGGEDDVERGGQAMVRAVATRTVVRNLSTAAPIY